MVACGSEPASSSDEESWLEEEGGFANTGEANQYHPTEAEAEAIKRTISQFLNARSVQDLAPLISEPEQVMPEVEEYYRTNSFVSGGVYVNPEFRAVGKYIVTKVTLDRGTSARLLALEKTDSGYKVNWELFVREIQ